MRPELEDVLRDSIRSELAELHHDLPGKIVKVTGEGQDIRVDVEIQISRKTRLDDGPAREEQYPVLADVPIEWPGGNGFFLQWHLVVGDFVWLRFSDANWRAFEDTGKVGPPEEDTLHGLSGASALPARSPADRGDHVGIFVDSDGVTHVGAVGTTGTQFAALANHVTTELNRIRNELGGMKTVFDAHVHLYAPGPGSPIASAPPAGAFAAPAAPGNVAATKLKAV